MKPIRLSEHALRYTSKRGFTVAEVEETIRTSPWMSAELGRIDCRKNFPYAKEWNGKTTLKEIWSGSTSTTPVKS